MVDWCFADLVLYNTTFVKIEKRLGKEAVVGISGQTLIIRKNVEIQTKKREEIQKICGTWNFRPNVNNPEKPSNSKKKGHSKNEAPPPKY